MTNEETTTTEPSAPDHAEPSAHDHSTHGYITAKDDYLKRLRRIEGQSRGLQRMVEEEKYCIDILTQVSAMTKALQAVAMGLLEDHISHCVVDAAIAGGPEAEAKIKEATDAIARLVRS
ncbi:metal-sensitive transcriptional regulator [Nocardia sp. NBC_01327]|uniref:metal-sensitive transcriptional regulator n=1 Tax=Nocardia sp. NBC_01327 TaxID=2903593 RepID=UPI003FA39A30